MKIEEIHTPVKQEKPARTSRKATNKDLPSFCLTGNRWLRVMVPTFLRRLGGYSNIWTVPDTVLVEMMRESLGAVYLDEDYDVEINCPVFRKVSVHLTVLNAVVDPIITSFQLQQHAYDYRSGFGSAGLAVVNNFFVSLDLKTKTEDGTVERWSDDDRAKLAEHLLTDLRFLYLRADGDDKKVSSTTPCLVPD